MPGLSLLGASLLSAGAALPLHLLPLLVISLGTSPGQPAAHAAAMASACMLGQMLAALALPAMGLRHLRKGQAALSATALATVLMASAVVPAGQLWLAWLTVGAACGALQFLGTTASAASPDPARAFALRLAVTLWVSGFAILGLQQMAGFDHYAPLVVAMGGLLALLCGIGWVLYCGPRSAPPAAQLLPRPATRALPTAAARSGLVVVFLLFAGQPGFVAFAAQNVQQRGVVLGSVAGAMALCKVAAGCAMLVHAWRPRARQASQSLAVPGVGVCAGVLGMALASDAACFLVALLVWELGLNTLSARLHAAVVHDDPASAGSWLTGAVLLGAAAGPLLHARAIDGGVPQAFAVFACLSAVLPVAWASGRGRVGHVA